ncbi:hypothetical protein NPIL_215501 [Nephila pilipes]|uniref:Uncharacterized protein n=1 Tax=Nephila pilipes TaxID=299642 RepID=A0A8X6TUR6_NEPPI|nr:hypothetical protein NPIL_215501 [Nephila pilipes]
MVYIPPKDAKAERRPAPLETIPDKMPASLEKLPTPPAPLETIPGPSPPEPILLKPGETTPFLPCHRKRSPESPPCSIRNNFVKSEPSEEDVRLLLKIETIETTQMKPKVGEFVMLFPNHPPQIWWVPSDQT